MIVMLLETLYLARLNMDRVFYSRSGCMHAMHFMHSGTKLPNLELKTQPKQHSGYST
jgi:hypothetical protein